MHVSARLENYQNHKGLHMYSGTQPFEDWVLIFTGFDRCVVEKRK